MSAVVANEQILQLLAESGEASWTVNLDGMHQLLGGQDHSESAEADAECRCVGECGCGHQHRSDLGAPWEVPAK